MTLDRVAGIARAVLYEGYLLYPYRPSSLKNQQRWTFGAVFPQAYAERGDSGDAWLMQTQALVRGPSEARLDCRIRFLHLVRRELGTAPARGGPITPAAALVVGDEALVPWDETVEREVAVPQALLGELAISPVRLLFEIPASRDVNWVEPAGGGVGAVIRTAQDLRGRLVIGAEALTPSLHRLTVRIENLTSPPSGCALTRETAQAWAFASTHTVIQAHGAGFISLTDPPSEFVAQAAACENIGTWPVLVGKEAGGKEGEGGGEEGEDDLLLSSPIILPDYPQIAPESHGDLFDGCEIDEILTLRILTLTDAEKQEMAAADPHARALLERTERLSPEELSSLHGALRRPGGPTPKLNRPPGNRAAVIRDHQEEAASPGRSRLSALPAPAGMTIEGTAFAVGDRVRLRPNGRADIMDGVLAGMEAIVEAIERDFDNRVQLAVTLVEDPGRDLGMDRFPGHRFFFGPHEVERLTSEPAP